MYDDIDFSRLFDESEDGSKYNLGSFDESAGTAKSMTGLRTDRTPGKRTEKTRKTRRSGMSPMCQERV